MLSFLREQLFRRFPTWNTILLNNLTHLFDWWEVKLWRVGLLSEGNFELWTYFVQKVSKMYLNWIFFILKIEIEL